MVTPRFGEHAAADGDGAWIVSTHLAQLFGRNQVITALPLAERLAVGYVGRRPLRDGVSIRRQVRTTSLCTRPMSAMMCRVDSRHIAAICAELRQDALHNLSLGGKEPFHSNFLAWFAQAYPGEAALPGPYPDVVIMMPRVAPSCCIVPYRSRTCYWLPDVAQPTRRSRKVEARSSLSVSPSTCARKTNIEFVGDQ
jgi:hypothetical protein